MFQKKSVTGRGADNGFYALLAGWSLSHYRPPCLVADKDVYYEDKNKTNKVYQNESRFHSLLGKRKCQFGAIGQSLTKKLRLVNNLERIFMLKFRLDAMLGNFIKIPRLLAASTYPRCVDCLESTRPSRL
jgi:hypothetical protein